MLLNFWVHLYLRYRFSCSLLFLEANAVLFQEFFLILLCEFCIVLLRKFLPRSIWVSCALRHSTLLRRYLISILAQILFLHLWQSKSFLTGMRSHVALSLFSLKSNLHSFFDLTLNIGKHFQNSFYSFMSCPDDSLNLNFDLYCVGFDLFKKSCCHQRPGRFILHFERVFQSNSSLQQRNDEIHNLCSFLSLQSLLVIHAFFSFVLQGVVKFS